MTAADDFRTAVEAGDLDGIAATLHDDINLYSPVKFKPFEGKAEVVALFEVLLRTFQDFRYVGSLAGEVDRTAPTQSSSANEDRPHAGRVAGALAEAYRDHPAEDPTRRPSLENEPTRRSSRANEVSAHRDHRNHGDAHVLIFRTTVEGKEIHGMDLIHVGESGLIEEFTVMVRPLSAAQALGQAVLDGFATPKPA